MKVSIEATMVVSLSKLVEMTQEDYEQYQKICAEGESLDERIGEIAFKYGLGINDVCDEKNPEDIVFEIVKSNDANSEMN
ncbi:hypothetical protein V2A84_00125 [Yersinia sp. 2553 StPb PI]|uniref:hypothetical protein n=1 Tax=Yersinia sp. 2553 StPb PI TaxID=3117411 RepID=UPI003FA43048